jgi:hypothetical protein
MTGLIFWIVVTGVWAYTLVKAADWVFFQLPRIVGRLRNRPNSR